MIIGERIKQIRIAQQLTEEELSKRMGYKHRSSINKIESSDKLTLTTVRKVAAALNVEPRDIMGWTEEKNRIEKLQNAYVENYKHEKLMKLYDSLNESGQEHVDSYISYVASDRKYQKNPLPILMAAHDDVVSEDETAKLKDDLDNL